MGKIAFVFSGQGAQYTGMGKELCECSPAAKAVFAMADEIRPGTSEQCFTAEKEVLSQTVNTQPCVFAVDLAAACAVEELGIKPDYIAGFSLGEITAVGYAGILSKEDAFRLVCRRAQLMEDAAAKSKGAMVAVMKLTPETVEELCKGFDGAWPVNYNSPAQTVTAMEEGLVEEFSAAVKAQKGKAVRLAVSGAFHSPFMESASAGLADYLENIAFGLPSLPVYSNVTAQPYGGDQKALLARQAKSPVQWQKTVENLIGQGVDTFIEVGPGKTLTGLVKKIDPQVNAFHVEDKATLEELKAQVPMRKG